MFGFLKRRKAIRDARIEIGIALHRQIREALMQDERLASTNLSSSFTVGYMYWFVRGSFDCLGVDGRSVVDKELKRICDGVLPGKLYDILSRQISAMKLARTMEDQESPILNAGVSPAQVAQQFEIGAEAGVYDAPLVSLSAKKPDNLKRHLLGQKLEYKPR